MSTTTGTRSPAADALKKSLLLVVAIFAVFFAYEFVLRYFVWNETAYGYYWQFRLPLLVHVTGGLIALLTGLWQLWTGLNARSMNAHPWTGRLYAAGILLGAFGAFLLAYSSAAFGFAWSIALTCLALVWLATTGMALYCIRKRNVRLHKQWMMRSYIVTFAFVTFRAITDYLPYEAWWGLSRPEMSNAAIWPVWVLPLLVYELYLQAREV